MDAGENQSSGIGDWSVVSAGESDVKGICGESPLAIGDAVVDGDGLSGVGSE